MTNFELSEIARALGALGGMAEPSPRAGAGLLPWRITRTSLLTASDPRRLGRYELLGRLGAGGMGVVYLGRGMNGVLVAVKQIRAELVHDDEVRRRFRREIQAARTVDARFTARVLDHDLEADAPFFVTEFIDGPDLATAVRTAGPLEPEPLLGLAVGLADALGSIHAGGLVHRDVKPANVLLAPDGPRLVDFGIAYAAEATELTRTGVVSGTPAWMAPEQAQGRTTSAATDVFSWAATVVFAGTGRPPFGEGRADAVLYRIVHDEPDMDGLPEALRGPVTAAMRKTSQDRPAATAVRDWCADLTALDHRVTRDVTQLVERTWVLGPTWTAQSPTLGPATGPTGKRRRRVAALVSVGVILLLVGIGIALSRHATGARDAIATRKLQATTERTTSTTQLTTTTLALPPVPDGQAALLVPACSAQCLVVGRVDGVPSADGPASFLLVNTKSGAFDEISFRVAVVSNRGHLLWVSSNELSAVASDGHITRVGKDALATDRSGNVLGAFYTGAHSGFVIVMRVTPDAITDFGTVNENKFATPSPSEYRDVDGDGINEIELNGNDYNPNYADGTNYTTTLKWDGANYTAWRCAKQRGSGPRIMYAPSKGAC